MRPRPENGLVVLLEASCWPAWESVQPLSHAIQPASMGELNHQGAGHACRLRLFCRKKTLMLGSKVSKRVLDLGHADSIAYCYTIRR